MCLFSTVHCFTHYGISFTGVYYTMTLLLSCIVHFLYLYADTLSIVTMCMYNNNNFPFAFSYIYHFHSYSLVIFLSSFLLPSIKCTKCEKIHVQYTKSTNCYNHAVFLGSLLHRLQNLLRTDIGPQKMYNTDYTPFRGTTCLLFYP